LNFDTPAATKLLGGLGLLVLTALAWLLVLGPKTSELSDARMDIATTRDQNDLLLQQLALLHEQQQQLRKLRADTEVLTTKFPATADQPGLFLQVTEAAAEAGIDAEDVTSLAPTPPVVNGTDPSTGAPLEESKTALELGRQAVTVSVEGSYDQTQRLLENLEQMPRAYLIQSLTLTSAGTEGTFATTITGDMFVMPPVPDPAESVGSPRLVAN